MTERGQPAPKLGRILVEKGLLTQAELDRALEVQEATGKQLGEVVRELDLVSASALSDMLAVQRAWRPLGRLLLERDLLGPEELEAVLEEQARTGERLGDIVRGRGLVSSQALEAVLAEQFRLEVELEQGFGGGLRGAIQREHQRKRGLEDEEPAEPTAPASERALGAQTERPDAETERLRGLQEALEERTLLVERLGATIRRKDEELEELRAQLAERDAVIAALEHGDGVPSAAGSRTYGS